MGWHEISTHVNELIRLPDMVRPYKVAVVAIDYPPKIGGGATRAHMITQALRKNSFKVTVFAGSHIGSAPRKCTVDRDITLVLFPIPFRDDFFLERFMRYLMFSIWIFFAFFKKYDFDVVIVCGPHPFVDFPVLLHAFLSKIISILDLSDLWPEAIYFKHFDFLKHVGTKVNSFIFQKYSGYVFMNEVIEKYAKVNYGIINKPSIIIRNVTDTELFSPLNLKINHFYKFNNNDEIEHFVLYHGTAGPYQGLMRAREALSRSSNLPIILHAGQLNTQRQIEVILDLAGKYRLMVHDFGKLADKLSHPHIEKYREPTPEKAMLVAKQANIGLIVEYKKTYSLNRLYFHASLLRPIIAEGCGPWVEEANYLGIKLHQLSTVEEIIENYDQYVRKCAETQKRLAIPNIHKPLLSLLE